MAKKNKNKLVPKPPIITEIPFIEPITATKQVIEVVDNSAEISRITSEISGLNMKNIEYINLRSQVEILLQYLNNTDLNLKETNNVLNNNFIINGLSADNYKLQTIIKNNENIIEYLNNTIIKAIDNEISEAKSQIASLETLLQSLGGAI